MKFIITALFSVILSVSFSQNINATTDDGKKVLLKPDGTWEYLKEKELTDNNSNTSDGDCSEYVSVDKDEVSGKTYVSAANMLVVSKDGGKKGFGIYPMLGGTGKSIIVSIQAVGAGNCIDDDDKINILFRDGSRLELVNEGKFNCDAKATLYFGGVFGKKKQMEELCTKEVKVMRVWTSDGFVEETFESDQSVEFMNTMRCLKDRM